MAQHPTYEALEKRVKDLEKELDRRKGVATGIGHRVKELNCIYDILRLEGKQDISQAELLQEIVTTILPPSWRHPETTRARITLEGREFESEDFRETPWKQVCDIMAFGERIGCLEVFYLEDKPGNEAGLFFKEERSLISAIAKHLGRIAERKWTEKAMRTSHLFLEVANMHTEMNPLLEEFVRQVKELTGCDAVGIRILGSSGDIPYEAYDGFSQRFYASESPLSIKSDRCMCINVIKGTTDPNLAFFTKGGSFYVNGTTLFLSTVPEADKGKSRNVCNAHGYESVALVPIRLRDKILGLIHLADRKEGMVPLEMVELLEGVAIQLASAIQRVRAEELSKQEKDRAQQYLDLAGVMFVAIDKEGEVALINKKGCEILGYKEEEIIGKNWFENFLPKRLHQDVISISQKIFSGEIESAEYYENPVLPKHGEERIIAWHNTVLRDEQGDVIGHLSSGEDITERKRTEGIIQAQGDLAMALSTVSGLEEGLRLCVEAALQVSGMDCGGVYLFDETSGTLDLMFQKGLPPGFVKSVSQFDADSANARLVRAGKPIFTRYQELGVPLDEVQRCEGLLSIAVLPVHHEERVIGSMNIASHSLDEVPDFSRFALETIATQIGSAIARLKAEEALRKKEATMQSIFRAAPIGIGLVSDRVLGWTNEQIFKITGYSSEELMGKSARILYPSDKDFEWVGKEKYAQIKEWGTGTVETCWKRKDGRLINVLLSSTPLDLLDLSAGVTFTALDISDRKKAEEEREALIKELEAKNAELEQFMYTVSHDLKSPLITIKGFLGVLEEDAAKADKDGMMADMVRIANAAEKMRSLLDELLEFSRAGRLVNPPKEALLEDLAREAMDVVAGRLAERNVDVEIAPGLPRIYGDVPRIQEVLENLIDNAVKYMGDQPNPHVEIGARRDGEERVLYIQDNGLGIDPRYHEKIFGLFDKLEPNSDGTGVGLAIVKRIIEMHGGRIWVESEGPGKGSAFCFTIPDKRESKMVGG